MKDQVDIHYNKIWAFFCAITPIVMTTLIILSFLKEVPFGGWNTFEILYYSMAGLVCAGSAIYFLNEYFIPALKRKSAVVINEDCITDNIKNIEIKWNNVIEVGRFTSRYSNYILIFMDNPKEITGQTNNIFKKLMYAYNKLVYGTPIVISMQFISGNTFDTLGLFLPFLEKQKELTT